MILFLLLNNFRMKFNQVKEDLLKDLKEFRGMYKTNEEFEDCIIEEKGNLKDYVLCTISYDIGEIRREYIVLLMPDFVKRKYKLELHLIAFDKRVIKSFKEYKGYYGKLEEFKMEENSLIDIEKYIKQKVESEAPKKIYS